MHLNFRDEIISLDPSNEVYIGNRGMVLHATRDDFTGQWGNAGPRVSCCVISEAMSLHDDNDDEYIDFDEAEANGATLIATGVMSLLGMFFIMWLVDLKWEIKWYRKSTFFKLILYKR